MTTDQFGVTTYDDGTMYKDPNSNSYGNGGWLVYYDPSNGNFAKVGDNNIYDSYGESFGDVVENVPNTGNAFMPAGNTNSGSTGGGKNWLDILNAGITTAGQIWGHNNTPQPTGNYPQPIYTPPPAKTGMATSTKVLLGLGGVALIAGTIIIVKYKKG